MEVVKRILSFSLFFALSNASLGQSGTLVTWEQKLDKAIGWFHRHDLNKDQKLSLEEFPENAMKFWPLANFDGDDYLTLEEEKRYQKIEYEQLFLEHYRNIDRISVKQKFFGSHQDQSSTTQDATGEWLCFTTMFEKEGQTGTGVMYMILDQSNVGKISGELRQLAAPKSESIYFEIDSADRYLGNFNATLAGELIQTKDRQNELNMIYLKRDNSEGTFDALFTGIIAPDGNSMVCQLINDMGNYGTMLVIRRDVITK